MSVFTNFLNLFKYNPTTEGEQTFNIDTALNENWEKVDAETQRLNDEIVQVKNDLQNVDVDVSWADVTSKPTTFPATAHGHAWGELTSIPSTNSHPRHTIKRGRRLRAHPPHIHRQHIRTMIGISQKPKSIQCLWIGVSEHLHGNMAAEI